MEEMQNRGILNASLVNPLAVQGFPNNSWPRTEAGTGRCGLETVNEAE